MRPATSFLRASLLATAILATPLLAEARKLDLNLQQLMPAVAPGESLEVIVSFHGSGPATPTQNQRRGLEWYHVVSQRQNSFIPPPSSRPGRNAVLCTPTPSA